jgi:hypothetical protein
MENGINATTLAQNIAEQCKQFEQSQEYKDMITSAVKKLYVSALDDVFRWGDFPNRVKEAIKNAMPNNAGDFVDLAKYNTLMIKALKETWNESGVQNHAVKRIQKIALDTINDLEIPEFVLMSDLLEAFIDAHADSAAEDNWKKPNVLMRESEAVAEYWDIGFEEEPESNSRYSSSKNYGFQFKNCLNIRAIYTNRDEKEFKKHGDHKCYELYAGKIDGDILGKSAPSPHSKYEKLICALYFGNAYLVWDDCNPEDMYYPHGY